MLAMKEIKELMKLTRMMDNLKAKATLSRDATACNEMMLQRQRK